jgi:glycosyltransferase involved in cell wall biosynthesis
VSETVTLVVTVLNERQSIRGLMQTLSGQSRQPDELIIVDGGSTDGTIGVARREIGADPSRRLVHAPGSSIAEGRNIGIRSAIGTIIAVTDAGTHLDTRWLEHIVAPLEADRSLAVASGFFEAGGESWFERVLTTAITPQVEEIDPSTFLPSSRSVAFRREWWERVGGYPEWLDHCEDLVFDIDLRNAGARFAFVPDAIAVWTARSSLRGFFHQYFNYARGDGHANLWPYRHAARYAAYVSGAVLVHIGKTHRVAWLVLAVGAAKHFAKPWARLRRSSRRSSIPIWSTALVPVIVITGDLAKIAGYVVGLVERPCRSSTPGRRASGAA